MKRSDTSQPYDLSAQIVTHARALVGRPYLADGLVGSHDTEEQFVDRTDAFDCVTFVEFVLAQCHSEMDGTSVKSELKALRYRDGTVSWLCRLHYFSDWLETNAKRGVLREVFSDLPETARTLSLLQNYPQLSVKLRFLPLSALAGSLQHIEPGDIIAFGTTRENLDLSHVGFFAKSSDGTNVLLHATKTFGRVIEEPLASFLERFGASPGLLVYRPLAGCGGVAASNLTGC
jgi:hypothetical protein